MPSTGTPSLNTVCATRGSIVGVNRTRGPPDRIMPLGANAARSTSVHIPRMDRRIHAALAHAPRDQLRVLTAEVDGSAVGQASKIPFGVRIDVSFFGRRTHSVVTISDHWTSVGAVSIEDKAAPTSAGANLPKARGNCLRHDRNDTCPTAQPTIVLASNCGSHTQCHRRRNHGQSKHDENFSGDARQGIARRKIGVYTRVHEHFETRDNAVSHRVRDFQSAEYLEHLAAL